MPQVIKCPACSAPLEYDGGMIEKCDFCGNQVVVSADNVHSDISFGFDSLLNQAQKLKEILRLVRSGNKLEAIKIYRETFGVGLAEAKTAVEQIERGGNINFQNVNLPPQNIKQDDSSKKIVKAAGIFGGSILMIFLIPIVLAGAIIIAVFWMVHNTIEKVTSKNNFPVFIATPKPLATPGIAHESLRFGGTGTGAGYFTDNRTVAVDGDGKVYSADYQNGRVQQFDSSGKFLSQWIIGDSTFLGRIIADRKGRLYILYSQTLEIYDSATQKSIGKIEKPGYRDIKMSSDGKLYAITYKNEFAKLDENGKIISKSDDLTKQLNFKAGTLSEFAVDALGNFYVADNQNQYILKFSPDAKLLFRFDSVGGNGKKINGVSDLAVDGKGRIFALGGYQTYIFNNEGNFVNSFDMKDNCKELAFDDKGGLWVATGKFVLKYDVYQ